MIGETNRNGGVRLSSNPESSMHPNGTSRHKTVVNPDESLMIKVFEPTSGRIDLLVTSVTTASLTSSRAIRNLVGELRAEMAERTVRFSEAHSIEAGREKSVSK